MNPLQSCGLFFDEGIRTGDREDRLASREVFIPGRITILKLDAEHLCQPTADLGSITWSHIEYLIILDTDDCFED